MFSFAKYQIQGGKQKSQIHWKKNVQTEDFGILHFSTFALFILKLWTGACGVPEIQETISHVDIKMAYIFFQSFAKTWID